ncbi:TldD/PmbA family protein [Candidatus Woesearchaeota archaeon]|nr:TldD/PmbA family protein [Candidatus Woesearchaeota archaeon]
MTSRLDLMRRELAKRGAEDVVLHLLREESQQVKFSNGEVSATKNWDLSAMLVFAAFRKHIVMTSVRNLSLTSLKQTALRLSQFARSLAPNKDYMGIAEGPFTYKPVRHGFDARIADRDSAEDHSLELVERVITRAAGHGVQRVAGVYEHGVSTVQMVTSGGVQAAERSTQAYLSVRALRSKTASGHMVSCSRILDRLDVTGSVDRAVDIAKLADRPRSSVKPGRYPVVFESLPFANLLNAVASSASVFYVESGLSCLTGKLGDTVASPKVTLYDDGSLPNGYDSSSFDEEGVPRRRVTLIRKGVLRSMLHNTSTARRYKTKSTGSAGLVVPNPTNVVLAKGNKSLEQLFSHVRNGIYVTNVWYTRFNNYAAGDFSTIPRDGIFLIRDGELAAPLKELRISDNLLGIMRSVSAVGKDARQVRGWEVETPTVTPPAAVDAVRFTRPGK